MNEQDYIQEYRAWRYMNFKNQIGFFPIFSSFNKIIGSISPGAVNLYIYIGLHTTIQNGTSYYSISRISQDLKKSQRTINNWIEELVRNNLIVRKQKKINGVSTTYLRPY